MSVELYVGREACLWRSSASGEPRRYITTLETKETETTTIFCSLLLLSNLPTTFTIFCARHPIRQSFGFFLHGAVKPLNSLVDF